METETNKQKEQAEFFFNRLLDPLNGVCIKHRMYLTRFEQEAPCWTLRGKHPNGGDAGIYIYYKSVEVSEIGIHWRYPSYKSQKIYSKSKDIFSGKIDEKNIEALLEKAVKELLEMKEGNWEKEIEYPEWSEKFKNKNEWIKAYGLDLPPIE